MTPLGAVVGGLVAVAVDLRLESFDVVPDPLGWLLVVTGLLRLARAHPAFAVAAAAGVLGLLQSWGHWASEPEDAVRGLEALAQTALVFSTCTGLAAVLGHGGAARAARRIRWLDLGLTGGVLLSLAGFRVGVDGEAATALLVLLLVLTVGVFVWFLVVLWTVRSRPGLTGAGQPAPRPA